MNTYLCMCTHALVVLGRTEAWRQGERGPTVAPGRGTGSPLAGKVDGEVWGL